MNRIKKNNGFSIIELSLALIVVGLVISAIYPAILQSLHWSQYEKGKEVVQTARQEIVGSAMINGTLPESLETVGHTVDPWNDDLFYRNATNLGKICEFNATNSSTDLTLRTTDNKTIENVAFLVGSKGEDGMVDSKIRTDPVELDAHDIVEYVTLQYLKNKLDCQ